MARTTIELRNVLQMENFNLFDFTYPCDDAAWKAQLEKDIVEYYYFEEIGQESIDRFKQRFISKMSMVMPYWNRIYASTKLTFDPLSNFKMTEIMDQTIVDVSDSSGTSTSNNDNKSTDHPQHQIILEDILTDRTVVDGTSASATTVEGNNDLNYTKTTEGIQGKTYVQLLNEYRSAILRINGAIIKELKPLFILVY